MRDLGLGNLLMVALMAANQKPERALSDQSAVRMV